MRDVQPYDREERAYVAAVVAQGGVMPDLGDYVHEMQLREGKEACDEFGAAISPQRRAR